MQFLSYLINGLGLGSVYAIIALGYTMVYGIAKMLNFAHGDIIMVGAYIAFFAITKFSLPLPLAVLAAMAVCTVLGVVIERLAYKPPGCSDHCDRRELFPPERRAAFVVVLEQGVPVRDQHGRHFTGLRVRVLPDTDHDRDLYHCHGLPHTLY